METIYYRLDAKRLTCSAADAEKQASGGAPVCYAFVPRTRPARGRTGVVVDFEAYRARMQQQTPTAQTALPRRRRRLKRMAGMGMELCATGSMVALAVGMLIRFFTL